MKEGIRKVGGGVSLCACVQSFNSRKRKIWTFSLQNAKL
jgi:hypothetical protein